MTSDLSRRALAMMLLVLVAWHGNSAPADDDLRDSKIWKELAAPTEVDFIKVPLRDVADYWSDLHRVAIYLDIEAFEKAGVAYQSLALTQKSRDQPLWKVLRETLKPAKLSFMIKNHTLTITTAEAAQEWQKKNITEEK